MYRRRLCWRYDENDPEPTRPCHQPSISDDGRYVTFSSYDSKIVPDDDCYPWQTDVFLRDRILAKNIRISSPDESSMPDEEKPNAACDWSVISADGTVVAFESQASNLVPEDNDNMRDVFVRVRTGLVSPLDIIKIVDP